MTVADIHRELDLRESRGRCETAPSRPELLVELQREVNQGAPDPGVIDRIAGGDVVMLPR